MIRSIFSKFRKQLQVTVYLLLGALLVVGFQNCGETQFSKVDSGITEKTGDPDMPRTPEGTPGNPDNPDEPGMPNEDGGESGDSEAPLDDPELIVAGTCDFDNIAPIPSYDTTSYQESVDIRLERDKDVVVAEAKKASLAIVGGSVKATHIGHLSSMAIIKEADLVEVSANSVGPLNLIKTKHLKVSAQNVETLALDRGAYDAKDENGLRGVAQINANRINQLTLLRFGKICLSTNRLEGMVLTKGSLDIRGIEVDGQKGSVGKIGFHRGAIYLKDVIVENMEFVKGTIYLDNAQINSLTFQSEGDIILKNGSPEPGHMFSVKGEIKRM